MRILPLGVTTLALFVGVGACSDGAGSLAAGGDAGSSSGASGSGAGGSGGSGSSSSSGSSTSGGSSTGGSGGSSGSASGGSTGGGSSSGGGSLVTYAQPFTGGQYNLGPVDYTESQFHNACAPLTKYDARVQTAEGMLLAGLWNGVFGGHPEDYCDACIWVVTGQGKSAMLRVVTYGDTTTNSIDVSPNVYQMLNTGEYPRAMTWQLAECPNTGPMLYEFQTASSEYWTSLWVRNARVPLSKVEVKSPNHPSYVALTRGTDGTLTDGSGFGNGTFSIRSTGVDGQQVVDTFAWPASGIASAFLTGQGNFQ